MSLLILKNISRILSRLGIEHLLQPALRLLRVFHFGRDFCQGGPIKARAAIVAINALGLVLALALRTN